MKKELSAQVARLIEFLKTVEPGEQISWIKIASIAQEDDQMKAKQEFYRAARKAKLSYHNIKGEGVEVVSEENAPLIRVRQTRLVAGQVKTSKQTLENVLNRVDINLPKDEHDRYVFSVVVLTRISEASKKAEVMTTEKQSLNLMPIIPELEKGQG